jgi:hypothetical protein
LALLGRRLAPAVSAGNDDAVVSIVGLAADEHANNPRAHMGTHLVVVACLRAKTVGEQNDQFVARDSPRTCNDVSARPREGAAAAEPARETRRGSTRATLKSMAGG